MYMAIFTHTRSAAQNLQCSLFPGDRQSRYIPTILVLFATNTLIETLSIQQRIRGNRTRTETIRKKKETIERLTERSWYKEREKALTVRSTYRGCAVSLCDRKDFNRTSCRKRAACAEATNIATDKNKEKPRNETFSRSSKRV